MIRKRLVASAAALGLILAAPVSATAETGGYAAINGLKMYYQVEGTGRPLVLLHGGVCTIELCLGTIRAALGDGGKVVAMEQQGHGRTADLDRPLSYEQMTEDTAALLRQLKIENADVFGYSMGGGIALRLAIKYPGLVRKVAVFGTPYSNGGLVAGFAENFKAMKPDDIPAPFREAYAKLAPNPKGWPALVEKIKEMSLTVKPLRQEDLRAIKAPVLVMVGDADIVRPEHAVEMFRLIPHAQLAVVPLSDHFAPIQRSDWVVPMLRTFFEAPMPQAK
jgi:pimeloyl-ACP methyl ester carboxylesterase